MNNEIGILEQLNVIRKELAELKIIKKDVLNFDEACKYLSVGSSHLYKLTSTHKIPCYQPNGKKLYFRRNELDDWVLRNRKTANDEIMQLATQYLMVTPKRRGGVL